MGGPPFQNPDQARTAKDRQEGGSGQFAGLNDQPAQGIEKEQQPAPGQHGKGQQAVIIAADQLAAQVGDDDPDEGENADAGRGRRR